MTQTLAATIDAPSANPVLTNADAIRLATPQRNFGAAAPCRSLSAHAEPKVYLSNALWDEAVAAAARAGASRIVLLGTVAQAAAAAMAQSMAAEGLHIDRVGGDHAEAITADFAFPGELDVAFAALCTRPGRMLLVAVELLEHLADPRPALCFMRQALLHAPGNCLLVIAPDAAAEPAGLRSWARSELAALLTISGFEMLADAPTHILVSAEDGRARCDMVLSARCTRPGYSAFLCAHGLPYVHDPDADIHLVLTDEHARIPPVSGGIGSYVEDLETLSANVFVAFNRGPPYHIDDFVGFYRCLHPRLFWDDAFIAQFGWDSVQELSLLLIQHVLFYYPEIRSIEYQECNGHGARIAAAKRAGLLASRVLLIARCHGSQIYLEAGFETWMPASTHGSRLMILEKIAIELADIVSIPSRYLHELYLEQGIEIDPARLRIEPYSYSIRMEMPDAPYRPVDTLVFFGRRQLHKGFAEFLDTLDLIDFAASPIQRVIIFGARAEPTVDDDIARISRLRTVVEIEECTALRGELHARLLALAPSALFMMPYRADNAPLSIYEVLSAGCQFLAADRGGIPELIPQFHHREVLTPIVPTVMRARIEQACRTDGALRRAMVASLQLATAAMLEANRRANLAMIRGCYGAAGRPPPPRIALSSALFTAAVPMLDPAPQDLRDLCDGLNAQTLPPQEVIFVDDGSEPTLRRQAEAIVAEALRLPWRFIAHDTNHGLAAARNTALAETRTPYFVPVDVDNIPMADNFRRLVHAMEADPRLWAASCYLQLFTEAVDWRDLTAVQDENHGRGVYFRPLGGGIVHSLIENNLGDAHGCYRVDAIRAIGGWDSYGKAKWEDWSLHLNILIRDGRILIVPSPDHLYRTRPGSMQQVYPRFPADRLKARALDLLPRFERYRLIALARELERLRADIACVPPPAQPPPAVAGEVCAAQPPTRLRHRAADVIGMWLDHARRFKYALAWALLTIYRTGRHLRQAWR